MKYDQVSLTVPARSEFAKTVRMTAAALATRVGMTYDEVDDVRMAVEEAFVYAVDSLAEDDQVTIEFDLNDDHIVVRTLVGDSAEHTEADVERRAGLATFILDAVCDSYEFLSDESGARSLRLVKRCGSIDDD